MNQPRPRPPVANPVQTPPARLLPSDPEAERALLGCLIRDPRRLDDVVTIVSVESFLDQSHGTIFRIMLDLSQRGRPLDPVLLADHAKRVGVLEDIGGPAVFAELLECGGTGTHAVYYASLVRGKAVLRQVISAGQDIAELGFSGSDEPETIAHRAVGRALGLTDLGGGEGADLAQVVHEVRDRMDQRMNNRGGVHGLPTGFVDLDEITGGFQNGEMIVIGARPSVGKTAFACNLALNASIDHQILFVSLEQTRMELAERMVCSIAQVDHRRIKRGDPTAMEMDMLSDGFAEISKRKLYIVDNPAMTILHIGALARRMKKRRTGLKGIFIDYLQLIDPENKRIPRQEQVSEISRRIKQLARELGLPVVILCQLNRESEGTGSSTRPRASQLRESGSIEQDADVIILMDRPERRDGERPGEVDLIIDKQRNGPTGTVTLKFKKEFALFQDHIVSTPFDAQAAAAANAKASLPIPD